MYSTIEGFIVNIFFITSSIFLLNIFIFEKEKEKKWSTFGNILLGSITIILCMTFPVRLSEGFFFDLRGIPIILGSLYGGYIVALPLISVTILYRYLLGGAGLFPSILLVSLYVIFPLFSNTFHSYTRRKKMIMVSFFALFYSMVAVKLTFFALKSSLSLKISLIFILSEVFGILFALSLVELLKRNIELRKELVKKEKLSIVSELAASISHEVRNPLTVTRGFIKFLEDPDLSIDKRKSYIELAISGLDRANAIITDYLTFAKPSFDKIETIDVVEEIRNIIDLVTPYANMRCVEIKIVTKDKLQVLGDKQKFHQAILNIAKNAIEAMPDGGNLDFSIFKDHEDDQRKVSIIIEDNGIGMDKEQLSRLGEPYFSTKENGTGLGMMVVYSIIEMMKGKLSITSEKGKGTKISIKLPIVPRKE